MKRRELITLVGLVLAGLPFAAQAELIRHLGVLMSTKQDDPVAQSRVAAFREGLKQLGWSEGRNLEIEWRWSGGDIERTREYAEELVRLAPDVLLSNGTPATAALKNATSTIPIVFAVVNDPVAQGFIRSMAHPGGNITGFSFLEYSMVGKSLEMLKQIAPKTSRVALMFNPDTYSYYEIHLKSFEIVARQLGLDLRARPRGAQPRSTRSLPTLGRRSAARC